MVQMESTTCTLRVVAGRKKGVLYILNGELVSAETQDLNNIEAAYDIIGWDDAVIDIEHACERTENEINQSLLSILMEAQRLKDEKTTTEPDDGVEATVPSDTPSAEQSDLEVLEIEEIEEIDEIEVIEEGPAMPAAPSEPAAPPESQMPPAQAPPPAPEAPPAPQAPPEPPAPKEPETPVAAEPRPGEEAQLKEGEPEEEEPEDLMKVSAGRDLAKEGDFELHVAPKEEAKRSKLPLLLGIVLIAAAAVYFFVLSPSSPDHEQIYQDTLVKVDLSDNIDEQVRLLEQFLATVGPDSEWAQTARMKITELQTMAETAAYAQAASEADALAADNQHLKAADIYRAHLRQFPGSPNAPAIKTKISELADLAEKTDYAAVEAAAASGKPDRIDAYQHYLKRHPQGKQVEEVKKLIGAMEGEYFAYIEKKIAKSARLEEWDNCTAWANKYIAVYPEGPRTEKLKKFLPLFAKNRLEYADYKRVLEEARAAGNDYAKARKVLADYLEAFPRTHLAKKIKSQIVHYEKMVAETHRNNQLSSIEAALLKSKKRFTANKNGTFSDKRTGLMWSTLDAGSALGNCLKYKSARAYVKTLNTGGFKDWRLPTPD
jgi:hypothetical protein